MNWPLVKFGEAPLDIIDGDRGKKYPKQNEFHEEGFCLFLNTGNVTNDGFNFATVQFITEEKNNLLRKGKLSRNDIVMTTRGTIGNVVFFHKNVPYDHIRINSGMVIFRVNEEILTAPFLYHFLRSETFKKTVNLLRSGAAQPQLPIRDIKKIDIPLPPVSEQHKIADFLSKYDNLIENNRRRIQLLEESARLLYREWFVHLRFPGYEQTKITEGLPEGWERKTIDEVADTIGGGTPSTKVSQYWEDGNITWFVPKDLTNNNCVVLLDSGKKISEVGLKKSSAKMLPPETILMSSRASIGYFGIHEHECCTNQGFISIIPKLERFKMYLLHNLMNRVDEIIGLAGGTTYKEINKSTFRSIPVVVPHKQLLEEFKGFAYNILKQTRILMKQNQKLAEARDLLLPRLMNGEIAL